MLAADPMCARTGTEWWWTGPAEPCQNLASVDDHIRPLAEGGDLHDPANRQGLCVPCSDAKSQAEARRART